MSELIKIEERDGQQLVSARELYGFLGIGTDFTDWCKRMFSYGFLEGQDYCLLLKNGEQKSRGGHNATDYALTLDCAKEIAMIQRTERGKQARQYFIECEKKLKSMDMYDLMEYNIQRLRDHDRSIKALQAQQTQLLDRIGEVEAKTTTVDEDYYALAGYYRTVEKRFDLSTVQAQQTGKTLTRKSRELGYEVKKIHQERYGYVNTYHKFVLQAVLGF